MMHSQFLLRVTSCVALGGAFAVAQQQGITALRGARVHTAAGPAIDKGVVVMANGRIVAVGGADLEIPSGAKVVDCSGQVLTPGFVDASTTLGIAGNANEEGNEITAAVRVPGWGSAFLPPHSDAPWAS